MSTRDTPEIKRYLPSSHLATLWGSRLIKTLSGSATGFPSSKALKRSRTVSLTVLYRSGSTLKPSQPKISRLVVPKCRREHMPGVLSQSSSRRFRLNCWSNHLWTSWASVRSARQELWALRQIAVAWTSLSTSSPAPESYARC